jgi:hypothetical protein
VLRLKLWTLVGGLALGNLLGCSRAPRNFEPSDAVRSGPEVAEGAPETIPGTNQDKPSPCIKWAKGSGRLTKPVRKAVKTTVGTESPSRDRQKRLQAENENPQL